MDSASLYDVTRFSEDSRVQQEDRLAVLEFELRKARDTIHSLRSELTSAATKPDLDAKGQDEDDLDVKGVEDEEDNIPEIRGHEQRTLNYLVNEYLLQHGYKLTSITFSDENCDEGCLI